MRGHPSTGIAVRQIEGRPTSVHPGPDGRERVHINIVEGESAQIVLIERIAHVRLIAE